jgi:hypothetical protein
MFDLIVLGLILAGLTAIARGPKPRRPAEPSAPTFPGPNQTEWRQLHKPTYLRRGIVLMPSEAEAGPANLRPCNPVRSDPC